VTVLQYDVDALALPQNSTMVARWKTARSAWLERTVVTRAFHWAVPLVLFVNRVFWDNMERHMLSTRKNKENSISNYMANPGHKRAKRALEAYTLVGAILMMCLEGLVCDTVFAIGCALLVLLEAKLLRPDEDDIQTVWNCFGLIIVPLVAICTLTKGHEILLIVKFSSVFPYFFMIVASVPAHGMLKMRSEIQLYKHLFDAMVVLFVRM
jgi:hypothetical protein